MQSNFEYFGNLVRGNFRTNREKDAATKKQRIEKSERSQFLSLSKKSCINIEEEKKNSSQNGKYLRSLSLNP